MLIKVSRLTVPVGLNEKGQVMSQSFSQVSGKEIYVTSFSDARLPARYAVIIDRAKNEIMELPLPAMGYSYSPVLDEKKDEPRDQDVLASLQGAARKVLERAEAS